MCSINLSVCTRRKLKVNAGKKKMMVFERREVKVIDRNKPYRTSVPAVRRYEEIKEMGGEK